jgi:two-component system response regulator PilR (NtrC family)
MSSPSSDSQTHRVLIVDDEPALLDALRTALRRAGCDVTACRTFEDAREQLLTDDFDVLVTDVRLGAFNGIQLAVIARDKSATIRIIVFSGYDDPVLKAEAARLGGIYMLKPVTAEMLLQHIACS